MRAGPVVGDQPAQDPGPALPLLALAVRDALDREPLVEERVVLEEALGEEDVVAGRHAVGGVRVGDDGHEAPARLQDAVRLGEDVVEEGVLEEVA